MNSIVSVRRSIDLSELSTPSEAELKLIMSKIKDPVILARIYKINNHIYRFIYMNKDNGSIMSVAIESNGVVYPLITDEIIKIRDARCDVAISEGDFKYCISMADGQHKFLSFNILKNIIPNEMIVDCFLDAYKTLDYGFAQISKTSNISQFIDYRRLSESEMDHISDYIDATGYITIYRAQGSESTPINRAISWTVDLDVAYNFATRHNLQSDGIIYVAKVKPSDITAFISIRNEAEVIVNFKYLEDVRIHM